MRIQFVAKKIEEVFEAATIIDGQFARAAQGKDSLLLFSKLVGPFIAAQQEEGATISVDVTIITALDAAAAASQAPSVVARD